MQLFKLDGQRLNVMFRRNAEAIQGATNPCVESLFDLVQLNFDLATYAAYLMGGFVKLVVGGVELFVDALAATFFNAFAGLDQLIEVVGTLLPDTGVSANARQPDLACVAAHFAQRAQGVFLFLHSHFGHVLCLIFVSGGGCAHGSWADA